MRDFTCVLPLHEGKKRTNTFKITAPSRGEVASEVPSTPSSPGLESLGLKPSYAGVGAPLSSLCKL